MPRKFLDHMEEALRLTRAGNLQGATTVIQNALFARSAGAHAERPTTTIDVEARPIDAQATSAPEDASQARVPRRAGRGLAHRPAPTAGRGEPGRTARAVSGGAGEPGPGKAFDEQFLAGVFERGSERLRYFLYEPPRTHARALPLLVMLHGCSQTPEDFAAGTGMNDVARAKGFYVLYPAQSRSANPQRCWNWFRAEHQQRGLGEPAALASLTEEIIGRHRIDPERVYVTGLSAGGAMAVILGETYPDVFAAVGVHSGLAAGSAASASAAFSAMQGMGTRSDSFSGVPVIVFHGDADTTVDASNGVQIIAAAVADRAPSRDELEHNGRLSTRLRYRNKDRTVCAEHWTIHGAGHAWSGGDPVGSFTDERGPNASAEIARFLLQQRRQKNRRA